MSESAQAARIGRTAVYEHRNQDPAFRAAWDEAVETACDALEAEAWRRAKDGVRKPVYQGGEKVGEVREYSDTLLIFLLKGHRPERFRERVSTEISGPGGGAVVVQGFEAALQRIYGDRPSPES